MDSNKNQFVYDSVIHSGALGHYSWYKDWLRLAEGECILTIADPDNEGGTVTKRFGAEDVVRAAELVLERYPWRSTTIVLGDHDYESSDIDAEDADVILQTLLLGDVAFG